MQTRLEDNETWLHDTTTIIQQHMQNGETADSNRENFNNWCGHITAIEEMVSNVKNDIEKGSKDDTLGAMAPDSLIERINSIQVSLDYYKSK